MQSSDLRAANEEVKDSWVMTRILSMLPPKLYHFRTAWDNVNAIDKTINNMLERLKIEEDRQNEDELTNETSSSALISK